MGLNVLKEAEVEALKTTRLQKAHADAYRSLRETLSKNLAEALGEPETASWLKRILGHILTKKTQREPGKAFGENLPEASEELFSAYNSKTTPELTVDVWAYLSSVSEAEVFPIVAKDAAAADPASA